MTRQLGPLEAIEVATSPVESDEQQTDPADKTAMEHMYQAFGRGQLDAARRTDSIFRRLHSELAGVERRDGSTKVVTAANRSPRDQRLGAASGSFQMRRDWDPTDPDNQ